MALGLAIAAQLGDDGILTRREWEEEADRIMNTSSGALLGGSQNALEVGHLLQGGGGGGSGGGGTNEDGQGGGAGAARGGRQAAAGGDLSSLLKSFRESVLAKAESDGVALQLAKDSLGTSPLPSPPSRATPFLPHASSASTAVAQPSPSQPCVRCTAGRLLLHLAWPPASTSSHPRGPLARPPPPRRNSPRANPLGFSSAQLPPRLRPRPPRCPRRPSPSSLFRRGRPQRSP